MKITAAKFFLLLTLTSSLAWATGTPRQHCPKAPAVPGLETKTLADYQDFFQSNAITYVSSAVDLPSLENFIFEYNKFPESLRREMVENYATIHLLVGTSVVEDPTWNPADQVNFVGRNWSEIPGAGGTPSGGRESRRFLQELRENERQQAEAQARWREYCRRYHKCDPADYPDPIPHQETVKDYPTRIVINQIYNHSQNSGSHGSNNLILHEHGHALDSTFAFHGISSQFAWQQIMNDEVNRTFLVKIDSSYSLHPEEGFAEGFAYYNNCEATRSHMEAEAPAMADYFRNLTSIPQGQ